MVRRSDPAQTVIDYINTLEGFRFRSPDLPYDHMGATLTDAILQAGLRYDSVVAPRVRRVGRIAKARTTTGFLSVLEERGAASLLSWNDDEKPNRLVSLTHFLANHEIEAEIELRLWLQDRRNVSRLRKLRGMGDKTIDYLRILSGIPDSAVDRHLRHFVKESGLDVDSMDYGEVKEIIETVARRLGRPASVLDYSIWLYMSSRKGRAPGPHIPQGGRCKVVTAGSASPAPRIAR